MFVDLLMAPGERLMRRMRFGGKLSLLASMALLPLPLILLQRWILGGPAPGASPVLVFSLADCVLLFYFLVAFYRTVAHALVRLTDAARRMVQGDMRVNEVRNSNDELGDLLVSLEELSRTVSGMVANVRSNAAFVAHAGQSLAAGNRDLSNRTEQQAANLEQTAASVQDLSTAVQENASSAGQSSEQAAQARDVAERGVTTMNQAIAAVESVQGSARRMDEIVGVIDGLAFQTNILALNAAVEAARAGESGRVFAVVASEVRSLAQRSAESAKEIRQLIGTSSEQVHASVDKIRDAGATITRIVSGIRDVAGNMAAISTSCSTQSTGLSEISTAVRQIDSITQSNAQMVVHAVDMANDLERRAATLVESVAFFRLQQGSAEEARALVQRAVAHYHRNDKRGYLRDITDPTQGYFDRDMYVFVLDAAGQYLAFGGNPEKVGTMVQDISGIDGAGLVRDIVAQADHEPGWVEYAIVNPTTGRVQNKMSYVQKIDDMYVGCGVYINLIAV